MNQEIREFFQSVRPDQLESLQHVNQEIRKMSKDLEGKIEMGHILEELIVFGHSAKDGQEG